MLTKDIRGKQSVDDGCVQEKGKRPLSFSSLKSFWKNVEYLILNEVSMLELSTLSN